jgi:small subunit ribosomal protein S16
MPMPEKGNNPQKAIPKKDRKKEVEEKPKEAPKAEATKAEEKPADAPKKKEKK